MFDDLIVELDPPENRRGKCQGKERHLTEAAVMLAYGMHLLRTVPELRTVTLNPDGEHAKRFDIALWLSARGFVRKEAPGKTAFVGTYMCGEQSIVVASIPGKGDVVAATRGKTIIAECKGGIIKHPPRRTDISTTQRFVRSRWFADGAGARRAASRRGPRTETTLRLARKLAPRARDAGIEIALVDELGRVTDIVRRYESDGSDDAMSDETERKLRQRLEEMTHVDDVSRHPALLAAVNQECPNSVALLDSVHPIRRYTCLMYVFDFAEKPEYAAIATHGLGRIYAAGAFAHWLLDRGLLVEVTQVEVREGDFVFYFNNEGRFKHAAICEQTGE